MTFRTGAGSRTPTALRRRERAARQPEAAITPFDHAPIAETKCFAHASRADACESPPMPGTMQCRISC